MYRLLCLSLLAATSVVANPVAAPEAKHYHEHTVTRTKTVTATVSLPCPGCSIPTITIQPPCASPQPPPGSGRTTCEVIDCISLTTVSGTCRPKPCTTGSTSTVYNSCPTTCQQGCYTWTTTQFPSTCPGGFYTKS